MKHIKLHSVDSTNNEAKRLVDSHGPSEFVVSAGVQTSGRGRYNRVWQTPEGNIAVTIVVPIPEKKASMSSLALMTGIAIHDALFFYIERAEIKIKWPNDILINNAKISGTLIEADSECLYIGIGINQSSSPKDVPYATTSLNNFTKEDSPKIIDALIERWFAYYRLWQQFGFSSLQPSYNSRMFNHGRTIDISFDMEKKSRISGICRGVDDTGMLLLEDHTGVISKFANGEIDIIDLDK